MKNKAKRIICILLACLFIPSPIVFAQQAAEIYTVNQRDSIIRAWLRENEIFRGELCASGNFAYWDMSRQADESFWKQLGFHIGSWATGNDLDEQRAAENLITLITLQSYELAQQVENQSKFDALQTNGDLIGNTLSLAAVFLGSYGTELAEYLGNTAEVLLGGFEIAQENVERIHYYEATFRDYSRSKELLTAVAMYAENEKLRQAAQKLLPVNDRLAQARLEYLADFTGDLSEFSCEFFVENIWFDLLKKTDGYASDQVVQWVVNGAETVTSALFSVGEFTYKGVMLVGDLAFGTTDTFTRYVEIRVLADVAQAMTCYLDTIVPGVENCHETIGQIQRASDAYKLLISIHARGEYVIYSLLAKDAGLLSQLRDILDVFKAPEETTESWYYRQIDALQSYSDALDRIFSVEEDKALVVEIGKDDAEEEALQKKPLSTADEAMLKEQLEQRTDKFCYWFYCDENKREAFALVESPNSHSRGEFWHITEADVDKLLWFDDTGSVIAFVASKIIPAEIYAKLLMFLST